MPREFAILALLSIPLWLIFELYNLRIRNWYYTGLPENTALRLFGYAWSFATIWPAIFIGAQLVDVWRPTRSRPAPSALLAAPTRRSVLLSIAVGAGMLASPFLVAPGTAQYLAAPVWLGFILLLDPVNARLGAPSLWADLSAGRGDRTVNLMLSGLICGVLWEFWNFWAAAKWRYTVPIMEDVKIFEMPLPGYLGFPAFALECFTMYVFVRSSAGRSRCNFPLGEF
jgi:hypothetical protein